jgi:hypothetical protein
MKVAVDDQESVIAYRQVSECRRYLGRVMLSPLIRA